jgi:hypothetical protein
MRNSLRFFIAVLIMGGLGLMLPRQTKAQAEVKFSGFVLLNAQYNDGNPANPDIVSAAQSGAEGSVVITPRQSRFLISIATKDVRWSPKAKIEIDFWGLHSGSGPGGVTQPAPRLRLAYFEVEPRPTLKLTFGQAWTVFSPLNPTSLAHVSIPANSGAGNLWARLPMLRLDAKGKKMEFSLSLNRPHGGDLTGSTNQSDLLGAGERSKLPMVQARLASIFGKHAIGLSAHFGKLDFRLPGKDKVTSQGFAGDVKLAFGKVGFMGEAFSAKNIGTMFSGIKAATANNVITELEGKGGWAQIAYEASAKVTLNVGGGTEDRDNDTSNTQLFANLIMKPDKPIAFALEIGQTETKSATATMKNLGLNLACQYNF